MDWYQIILRVVHIFSGVFWVGTAIFFFFFIEPSVKELGTTGEKFLGHVTEKKKAVLFVTASAALTILAGILLYWRDSDGFDLDWITSATGLGFTVGSVAGILAFAFGLIFIKPAVDRMGAIGQELATGGGPPTEAQAAEMQQLGARLTLIGRIDLVLLTVAVVAMATARYL
ncbi:MAG: hypothetical protein ACRDKA_04870 [Actinomycetota bacterium]